MPPLSSTCSLLATASATRPWTSGRTRSCPPCGKQSPIADLLGVGFPERRFSRLWPYLAPARLHEATTNNDEACSRTDALPAQLVETPIAYPEVVRNLMDHRRVDPCSHLF